MTTGSPAMDLLWREEIDRRDHRIAELERELAELRAELREVAPLLAVHGVPGYTVQPSPPDSVEYGDRGIPRPGRRSATHLPSLPTALVPHVREGKGIDPRWTAPAPKPGLMAELAKGSSAPSEPHASLLPRGPLARLWDWLVGRRP